MVSIRLKHEQKKLSPKLSVFFPYYLLVVSSVSKRISCHFNPFSINVPLLYPLRTVFWCFQGVLKWNIGWKLIKNAWLTFPFSISFVTNKITQLPSWYTILQKSRTVSGRQPCVAIYSCSLSPFKNKRIFFPWWKSPGRKNDF